MFVRSTEVRQKSLTGQAPPAHSVIPSLTSLPAQTGNSVLDFNYVTKNIQTR
jgi:hypothetical protein